MTYSEANSKILADVVSALESCGFQNGDKLTKAEIKASSAILFYNGDVDDSEAKSKDFISYGLVPVYVNDHADNSKVFITCNCYVDYVTSGSVVRKSVKTMSARLEEALTDAEFIITFNGIIADAEDKLVRLSFNVSKGYGG